MESIQPSASSFFLTVKNANIDQWTYYFYNEFSNIFLDSEGKFDTKILETVGLIQNNNDLDLRIQLTIKGTPFLVGFFYSRKEVRFYTPKLSQELFLLGQESILELSNDQMKFLKEHTKLATSIKLKNIPSTIELLIKTYHLPDLLNDPQYSEIEKRSSEIIKKLLTHLNEYSPTIFENATDYGLGLTAQYSLLRVHLLKFLAILPSLDHDKSGIEVKRILIESLNRFLKDNSKARRTKKKGQDRAMPAFHTLGIKLALFCSKLIPAFPLALVVRKSVKLMAKRFIAGESIELAEKSLKSLSSTGRDVTLDQLGELVVSEKEADHYKKEVLKLIRGFSLHVKKGDKNQAGINRAHVSIKVSALCSDFKPHAPDYTFNLVAPRLKEILLAAKQEDVFINIDAEHYHYRDIVFKIYKKVLLETSELHDFPNTGIVIQAYLRDAHLHLLEIIELAKLRGHIMPVRLVKGAYWDAETVEGDAHSFNAPQFLNKEETDIHFRQLILKIYEAYPHLKLAIASHNFSDHAFAESSKELLFPNIGEIEHQCLHMTYEALSTALAKMNWATRNYVPVGSLLVGMAYLVRRIMENSSQVGVLTIMRSHKKHQTLLSPYKVHVQNKLEGKLLRDLSISKLEDEFFNVSPLRLYLDSEREWMINSLKNFELHSLNRNYANSFKLTGENISIVSSSNPEIIVGTINFANIEDTKRAIDTIDQSYKNGLWANYHYSFRAATLIKAATLMLARRNDLSSLIVYEAGKSVNEALADVDEAIDFLNFYARNEISLNKDIKQISSRGPCLVISPWNFPLAIPCGMVVSSLVAGNTVILKSAEQTPLIAQVLVDLLHESGVPKDALIHLPGIGEIVGEFAINDSRISTIIFTGSKAVGTHISQIARKRLYENKLLNKTYAVKAITEMGGKNAVIVTQNAELDETVSGILYSAFGHAGQKCSACSRVIVHNSLKNKLLERLKDASMDLKVGESFKFDTTINPIISIDDQSRLRRQVREATDEAKKYGGQVIVDRSNEKLPGYCIGPTIIELPTVRAFDKESFAAKELFGPVLHVVGFDTLEEAALIYNSTDYALTGGIFSQSQNDIDFLLSKIESGNIYINRTITGARVAIEPFGGFKLSGTGPKAGSLDYLISLHQIKESSLSEKQELAKNIYPIEEGSAQHIELCKPSKLSNTSRLERLNKFLENFISNYESYVHGAFGNDREILREFRVWINKEFIVFKEGEHKNRVIPGQLSFNDFRLSTEHAIVVSSSDRPSIKTLIQFLSAITVGTGVLVLCRNSSSYTVWKSIKEQLVLSGFSKENIDVKIVTASDLKRLLNSPKLSAIIYDGHINEFSIHVGNYLDAGKNDLRMRQILLSTDHLEENDFYHQLLNFVWVRSLAVNTMRHGAPLDLEV